ncbi:uncharacterized protein LOC141715155 [Apium graveolens]|uniref:uncharacterized protein LOC141715155 n=1 Tax=Apium graveolens TaxID=4045 RepID=UPI003D7A1117
MEHIEFQPGLIFTSRELLRYAIRKYGVARQRRVFVKRSDFKRMHAKCREGCKWELWASKLENDKAFQIKTYKGEHNCIIVSKQRMVKADWLAKEFGSTIRSNPRWKLKKFAEAIHAKYKIQCTLNQCWWAKKAAMSEVESVLKEHYARLRDYGVEVLRINPGSSLFIKGETSEESENPTFQRLYICFAALRIGFLNGCRKVIGLDGCFLKGYIKGELLTAIGRDANNQMFSIAWAVVEVEYTESWAWFIQLLKDDLNIVDGYSYTIITDQQKGLKNAIDEYLPAAEHRCCARHIHANWKKNHPGNALKNAFWRAAKASTIAEFNICMDEIRSISPFAYDDLLRTNPKYWSRAYFKTLTHCDVVDNNIYECFNSWILEARYKPIISMLDHIRVQCMEMIHLKRDYMAKLDTELCPRIIRKLNYNIEGSKMCSSTWDGGDKCEVKDIEGNQFEVDMKKGLVASIAGTGQAKKRDKPTISSNPNPSSQQDPTETVQKKKRGRPPKVSSTQVKTKSTPAGIGVLIGDDGHAYLSSSTTTVRVTSSQPNNPTETMEEVQRHSSSQLATFNLHSPLKKWQTSIPQE